MATTPATGNTRTGLSFKNRCLMYELYKSN